MDRFDSARKKLAQIGLSERAVNKGSGDIDPAIIGQALNHGEKLTGASPDGAPMPFCEQE